MHPAEPTPTPLQSIWAADGPAYPTLAGDLEVDVAIVGAGITGLTLALLLRESGLRVAVLELGRVGGGATGHTSGHLTLALDTPYQRLVRRFGAEGAGEAARKSAEAIDFIALRSKGIACDFHRVDGWRYAEPGASAAGLVAERDAADALGIPVDFHAEGPLKFMGPALRFPEQARFDPVAWVAGLAREFTRDGGGQLFENTRVERIVDGPTCTLEAGGGVVRAAHVVHATHTPIGPTPTLHSRIASYQSYVIAARIDGPVPPELYWDTDQPYHYLRSVMLADGGAAVLIGGEDHKTGQDDDTRDRFRALEDYARARFEGVQVLNRWSGRVLESADGLPYIGRIGPHRNVYGATGFGGNGLTSGTAAGIHLAGLILGADDTTAVFRPKRFRPFAAMRHLVTENANVAWRMLRDGLAAPERSGVEHVHPGTGEVLTVDGARTAVYRSPNGEVHTMSPVCPHAGGIVQWNAAASTWDCPLHGSRFRATGELLCGPATQGLATDADALRPSEELSMPELLETLHHQGYVCEFTPHLGGRVTCESCGIQADATEGRIDAFHRFEGVSDPDDVCLVAALRLPHPDGECRGLLVLGFGPSASAEDKAILSAIDLGARAA